jgi:hypothetical protein
VCGNGFLEDGETCEGCAQDCMVLACTATTPLQQLRVDLGAPAGRTVTAATVLVGYKSNIVSLPGTGSASTVRQRVKNTPSNSIVQVNDLDYALRIVVGRGIGIPAGRLATIDFDSCQGAAAATPADFGCTVEGCGDGSGPIPGCTCTITTP